MTKNDRNMLLGGGAALLLAGFIAWRVLRTEWKEIWDWNETINTFPGRLFTVRVPRGEYTVATTDLFLQVRQDIGTESRLVMVAPTATSQEYTIRSVLIEEDTGQAYPIEVVVHPNPIAARSNPAIPETGTIFTGLGGQLHRSYSKSAQFGVSRPVHRARLDRPASVQGGQS